MEMTDGLATVADVVRVNARARADAPAIDFEGRTISFGELDERSNRVANALAALGVGPGDRVAFLDKNGPEYFEVLFGVAKLNAVTVAVNWRLAPDEVAQVVDDSGATLFVVGSEFTECVEAIEDRLPSVKTMIALGDHPRWTAFRRLVADADDRDPGVVARRDDIALQLYTSGTTGLPKGVMISNENLFSGPFRLREQWRLDDDSVVLAMMPMFHIAGSGWAIVSLGFGCRTVVHREIDPPAILRDIEAHGVTNALFVPAVINFLLHTPGVETTDFSSLRKVVYGASPITDTVLVEAMRVLGCEFVQVYGLTETTGAITQLDHVDHDPVARPHLLRSCGKPYPWVEVRIVDPDRGVEAGVGEVGELWTRSCQNMVGYWANDAATGSVLDADGWFRTGDAGYVDSEGYLYLHDRVKDMIVTGGENVYPAEVENVLARHPDVADVAVVGVPDEQWGEAVMAVVVRRPGRDLTGEELVAFARDHLGGYKLPKSIAFAEALPRNPSGKLLKREIRAPYWEGRDRNVG
jgi:long-chain acyl-CoA synthetase